MKEHPKQIESKRKLMYNYLRWLHEDDIHRLENIQIVSVMTDKVRSDIKHVTYTTKFYGDQKVEHKIIASLMHIMAYMNESFIFEMQHLYDEIK